MKFLKSLISFVIPLFIVLTTFALYSSITNVVSDYKNTIINDYSIMIVTHTPLIKDDITTLAKIKVNNIETLKRKTIIKNLKGELSKTSLKLLEQKLPFFYNIYLDDYPTTSQLAIIRIQLSKISNIKRIETFSSDHTKIYSLLVLCEQIIAIVFVFILIFAILILLKQIKIWFFEHSKRISIIEYHGGSIIYSALPIIKIAIFSSIIASALTIALVFNIVNNLNIIVPIDVLNIIPNIKTFSVNYMGIIILSFCISLFTTIGVLIKHKIR